MTRQDILEQIRNRESMCLGPFRITVGGGTRAPAQLAPDDRFPSSISLWISQGGRDYEFIAEVSALSTPKALQTAAGAAKRRVESAGQELDPRQTRCPTVIAPYLSEKRLDDLASQGVCGLDLCGNGVLAADGLYVYRAGCRNRYPQSTRLRKAYQGRSSLVPRALLLEPEFRTAKALGEFVAARGGRISASQISKVLKQLAEDLLVSRDGGVVRVTQPVGILEALGSQYKPPRVEERWIGRCGVATVGRLSGALARQTEVRGGRAAMTGACSASLYAGFAAEPILGIYTDLPIREVLAGLDASVEEGRRFANLEILRTHSAWVYFDARASVGVSAASPIQAYVELVNGDARQRSAAQQIRQRILADLGERGGSR